MKGSPLEVARVFLKLGLISFGGPAAHTAMMHDEVVRRRGWVSDEEFLDLVAASNLLPGPNSSELAIHLGWVRAGWAGMLLAGVSFMLPATLIVVAIAAGYRRLASTPEAGWLLYGIKPVVIAIVAHALLQLGRTAIRSRLTLALAVAAALLSFGPSHEIALLLLGGAVATAVANRHRLHPPAIGALLATLGSAAGVSAAIPFSLPILFLTFLKIGAVLYGSGYVLLAFLQADFVERLGWLTQQQLIDAVAVGQVTPGPLFTTATFIGFQLGGTSGALLATLGIFLPSFAFVAAATRVLPALRASPWVRPFLDGVIAASLGLMAAVTGILARASLTDAATVVIAAAALVLSFRFRVNSAWLVLAGALAGILLRGLP